MFQSSDKFRSEKTQWGQIWNKNKQMKNPQTTDKCIGSLLSMEFILTTITFLLTSLVVFCWNAESFISLIKWLLTLSWSPVFCLSLHLFRTGVHISSNFFQFIHCVWADEWLVSTCLYFGLHLILRLLNQDVWMRWSFKSGIPSVAHVILGFLL